MNPKAKIITIYKPPVTSGRLEGTYFGNKDTWAPSISYKNKLQDIISQRTPAEKYKYELQQRGDAAKALERLGLNSQLFTT